MGSVAAVAAGGKHDRKDCAAAANSSGNLTAARRAAAIVLELLRCALWSAFCKDGCIDVISRIRAMLEPTTVTESEIDHRETPAQTAAPARSPRDEFEAIWRIAGLPPCHLSRYADGTYKATYAMRAWDTYATTREWRAVMAAAKPRS